MNTAITINKTFVLPRTSNCSACLLINPKIEFIPAHIILGDYDDEYPQPAMWALTFEGTSFWQSFDTEQEAHDFLAPLPQFDTVEEANAYIADAAAQTTASDAQDQEHNNTALDFARANGRTAQYEPTAQAIAMVSNMTDSEFDDWNDRELHRQTHEYRATEQIWDEN